MAHPALFANHNAAYLLTARGEVMSVDVAKVGLRVPSGPVIVCHAPLTLQRVGKVGFTPYDVLELFAFIHPGKFLVPSPVGLAQALDIPVPTALEDYPETLQIAVDQLLNDAAALPDGIRRDLHDLATLMGMNDKGWVWTDVVLPHLLAPKDDTVRTPREVFARLLKRLPETLTPTASGEVSYHPVAIDDVLARLDLLLHQGTAREERSDQKEYATAVTNMFAPPDVKGEPNVLVAEAGTGIGKTLGYLAPSTLWAERNGGSVWVSTYTKNLQKQLDQELKKLPLNDADRDRYAVTRKGRENYLCLLNFADFAGGAAFRPTVQAVVAAGLLARWISVTRDGDFTGVDYPGWLTGLMGVANTTMMADRRGECIHGGCEFYDRCFIERSVRKAGQARIVLANHTLVMIEAARLDADDRLPGHFIFDEGHHLIDAADGVFATSLSLMEGYDLRRWLIGNEVSGRKSRLKGLKRRLEDLATDEDGKAILDAVTHHARILPGEEALNRLRDHQPQGTMEHLLLAVFEQIQARASNDDQGYSLETPVDPLHDTVREKLVDLIKDLQHIQKPLNNLIAYLGRKLEREAADMNADQRQRIQVTILGLERRSHQTLAGWISLAQDLVAGTKNPDNVSWMEITRNDNRIFDVGIFRHWRNPMQPFAAVMKDRIKGAVMTSATLRDRRDDEGWAHARLSTGVDLLTPVPVLCSFPSPFDYADKTRVIVINDVNKSRMEEVAGAYRALFAASQGGALGLFTAIQRLRAVQQRIVGPLEQDGLQLYAQHVDKMDNGTLVDLFRADRHACLLGTDAMRDGVDVPGDSLRLLVYDRVPWPIASLLHKARREIFGGRVYDEQIVRLRLKQAYGRLIRRSTDRGVFVMLDSALPSRLHDAFPAGVTVEKVPLDEACRMITGFLGLFSNDRIDYTAKNSLSKG
jgi:ATP-dependent DNA helicase DinG